MNKEPKLPLANSPDNVKFMKSKCRLIFLSTSSVGIAMAQLLGRFRLCVRIRLIHMFVGCFSHGSCPMTSPEVKNSNQLNYIVSRILT